MAELTNGEHKPDVEMKEESAEMPIDQVQDAPPFQPETTLEPEQQAVAGASGQPPFDGHLSTANAPIAPQITQVASQAATETIQPAQQLPVAEPPIAASLPATAPPVAQAPLSAPTPPAARESSRPSSMPPAGIAPPERPNAHGSPTRVYLNQNVTPHLLEGMKYLAAYEPEKPLKWLSEYLAKRSLEYEGE